MNFKADDFDWALGELLALIWRGKVMGVPAHKLDPRLFHAAMRVIYAQPAEVQRWAQQVINGMKPFEFMKGRAYEVARTA